jgi:hypothetical protein
VHIEQLQGGTQLARIERTARFNAPVEEVFSYIADFRTLEQYNPSILKVDCLHYGPPVKGCHFDLTLSMWGIRIHPVLTITDFRENELIVTRLDSFIPANEMREFQQIGDETEFHFTIEFASGWPCVGRLVDYSMKKLFAEPQAETEIILLKKRFNKNAD